MVYSLGLYPQFRKENAGEELLTDTVAPRYQQTVKEAEAFRNQFQKHTQSNAWYDFLRAHSAFARMFYERGIWPADGRRDYQAYRLNRAWAAAYPDKGAIYESGSARTVFMTGQHFLGLDLDNPRIAEGLRITKEMLLRTHAKATAANAKLLVLLIPTKELVYSDVIKKSHGSLESSYTKVVSMETRARQEIISLCSENGIESVDPVPELKHAIERGEQIYPWTGDSHFIPRGYFLLASEVGKAVARLGW